jgi:hypothetical protein
MLDLARPHPLARDQRRLHTLVPHPYMRLVTPAPAPALPCLQLRARQQAYECPRQRMPWAVHEQVS